MTPPKYTVAFNELNALLQKLADEHGLTSIELLAVASNMLGKIIALQDQRHVSEERAMAVVKDNIKRGNKQALDFMLDTKGSA